MDPSRESVAATVRVARDCEGRTQRSAMGLAVAANWARTHASVRPGSAGRGSSRSMRRLRQVTLGALTQMLKR
jgi:hypothetical protein